METFYGEPFVSTEVLIAAILPPKATSSRRVRVAANSLVGVPTAFQGQELAAEIIRARWISRL